MATPVITTIYGSNSNRTLEGEGASWDIAHDDTVGDILDNYDDPWYLLWGGSYLSGGLHYIYRPGMFFDLSGESGTLTNAVLHLYSYIVSVNKINKPYLHVAEGVQHDPIVGADYFDQRDVDTSWGSIDLQNVVNLQYNAINLNQTAIDALNVLVGTGTAKFCIRSQFDIEDSDPVSTYDNSMRFYSNQKGGDYRPKLVLTYGVVYPFDSLTRVTGIRHIYRPGFFRMVLSLGDITSDISIPSVPPKPRPGGQFCCTICGECFDTLSALNLHDRAMHPPTPRAPTGPTPTGPVGPPWEQPGYPAYTPPGPGTITGGGIVGGLESLEPGLSEYRRRKTAERRAAEAQETTPSLWSRLTPWREEAGETFGSEVMERVKAVQSWFRGLF